MQMLCYLAITILGDMWARIKSKTSVNANILNFSATAFHNNCVWLRNFDLNNIKEGQSSSLSIKNKDRTSGMRATLGMRATKGMRATLGMSATLSMRATLSMCVTSRKHATLGIHATSDHTFINADLSKRVSEIF